MELKKLYRVGRLEAIKKSNGSTLWSCCYDEAGRRVQTTGVYGLVTDYDYEDVSDTLDDDRGLYLDSIDNTLGSLSLDYDYVRDAVGNIETATTDGVDIKYLYDKNYSLTSVDYATGDDLAFNYDNLQNWTSVVEGSTTTSYTQNALGLNQYSSISTTSLTYDDNGNLTQQGTKHYLYDSENQMIAFYNLTGDPNETAVSLYSYDDFGRRISKASATGVDATSGVLTESYIYDGFQVIGEYTSDGQHIKRRYIYATGIDEPICMVVEPYHQGWYGLDEFSTIADSWLCEDGDACYNSEYDFNANDAIDASDLAEFVSDYYLDDRPLTESTKYYGYAFDGSGNVIAMTFCNDPNETGNPTEVPYFVESYVYDPFGVVTIYDPNGVEISQSEIGNPYMFTARRFDNESGLYYYRLRMYNPAVGRFMQTDPIGYYDSMNMYQYCGNNPVNYRDPWGLASVGIYYRDPELAGGQAANDYDYSMHVENTNDTVSKLLELINQGVEIDDLYIFGHGTTGYQIIGNEAVPGSDPRWEEIGNKVKKKGQINLRGCNVAGNGQEFIKNVAKLSQRTVTGFDDLVYYKRNGCLGADYYSAGNLWGVNPDGNVYIISNQTLWEKYWFKRVSRR